VRELLRAGGAHNIEVVAEAAAHPVASAEAWWSTVEGSGLRGTIEQLDPMQRARVRAANGEFINQFGITSVEVNVIYAVATKE
jgi:hypothetical protein